MGVAHAEADRLPRPGAQPADDRRRGRQACGVDGHVDDLVSVLDGRPSVVVGHRFGGIVGLVAARREASVVRAVAAFEAPMPWAPWWPGSTPGGPAAAEAFLRRMIGDERWDALPGREKRLREGAALIAEITSVRTTAP